MKIGVLQELCFVCLDRKDTIVNSYDNKRYKSKIWLYNIRSDDIVIVHKMK